jgi:hypothetical protein
MSHKFITGCLTQLTGIILGLGVLFSQVRVTESLSSPTKLGAVASAYPNYGIELVGSNQMTTLLSNINQRFDVNSHFRARISFAAFGLKIKSVSMTRKLFGRPNLNLN